MNIYLLKDGEKHGPYSIDRVVEFIRKGECMMSGLAWREGMADWKPIHLIKDIVEAALPPEPKDGQHQNAPLNLGYQSTGNASIQLQTPIAVNGG